MHKTYNEVTVAYVAIGVKRAFDEFEKNYPDYNNNGWAELADSYGGEIGIVEHIVSDLNCLDEVFEEVLTGPDYPAGVFDYEVSEPFGYRLTTMLLHKQLPEGKHHEAAEQLARDLIKSMQGG